MPTDYQQLEQKIQELQDEHQRKVNELQAEVDRLKSQEKKSKLPGNFNRQEVLDFLNDPHNYSLDCAFYWSDTPQGDDYWSIIESSSGEEENYKVPKKAKIQLLKWVVKSYQQQYGN